MTKLLRFRDKLLLGIALAGDVLEQGRDPGGLVSLAYKNVYGFIPHSYKKSNFYFNVKRMQRTGFIEKIERRGEPYLRLTSAGKETIFHDFPLLSLQKKAWDRKWRVVIFDIQEKHRRVRDILRRKLRELGFGMVQKSVWISPHDFIHDLREFLEEHHLGDYVFVMEVKALLVGDQRLLTNRIWRLHQLNDQYEKLYKRLDSERVDKGEVWQSYCDLLIVDPLLPKELLPSPWYGFLLRSKLIKS